MRYRCFGLQIVSDLEIKEFAPGSENGDPDVIIRMEEPHESVDERVAPGTTDLWCDAAALHIHCAHVGRYKVTAEEITVVPMQDVQWDLLRLPLLGLVFSAFLMRRSAFVLHGCVLNLGGKAVGFLGDKGFGKSTLAATLVQRGHALIADDVLVLNHSAGNALVAEPGPYGIKLWPDTLEALSIDDTQTYPLYSGATKRVYDTSSLHATRAYPLSRIYALRFGDELSTGSLAPIDGFRVLLQNSFVGRYPGSIANAGQYGLHKYGPLRSQVEMRLLTRRRDRTSLNAVAARVEEDLDV